MDLRFSGGYCLLGREFVDHPDVGSYTYTNPKTKKKSTFYRFPMRPEVVADMFELIPELGRYLSHAFYDYWIKALGRSQVIKEAPLDRLKIDTSMLKYQPFDHQYRAIAFSLNLPSCGLFMEIGTGKTFVALANMAIRLSKGRVKKPLVIAPLSILRTGWHADATKFTDLKPMIVHKQAGRYRYPCPICGKAVSKMTDAHAKSHHRELQLWADLFGLERSARLVETKAVTVTEMFGEPEEVRWNAFKELSEKIGAPDFDHGHCR
jgi:hypothetical protein